MYIFKYIIIAIIINLIWIVGLFIYFKVIRKNNKIKKEAEQKLKINNFDLNSRIIKNNRYELVNNQNLFDKESEIEYTQENIYYIKNENNEELTRELEISIVNLNKEYSELMKKSENKEEELRKVIFKLKEKNSQLNERLNNNIKLKNKLLKDLKLEIEDLKEKNNQLNEKIEELNFQNINLTITAKKLENNLNLLNDEFSNKLILEKSKMIDQLQKEFENRKQNKIKIKTKINEEKARNALNLLK